MTRMQMAIVVSVGLHAVLLGVLSLISGDLSSDDQPPRILLDAGEMAVTVWLVPPDYADQQVQPEPDLPVPRTDVQLARAPRVTDPQPQTKLPDNTPAPVGRPAPTRQAQSTPRPACVEQPPEALLTKRVTLPHVPLKLPESTTLEMPMPRAKPPVTVAVPKDTGVQQGVKLARMPKPEYPAACIERGQEGRVVVEAMILADGSVGDARVYQSSSWPQLDHAAVQAVRAARFIPARRGGRNIDATIRVPVRFVLEQR